MDEKTIRTRLEEAQRELGTLEERRDALVGLVKSYETLLRIESGGSNGRIPLPLPVVSKLETDKPKVGPKGSISISKGILAVLKDARGAPLHTKEILNRVLALGAITEAKNPQGAIDLVCYHLANAGEPMKKVGPRTWRWIGGTEFSRSNLMGDGEDADGVGSTTIRR